MWFDSKPVKGKELKKDCNNNKGELKWFCFYRKCEHLIKLIRVSAKVLLPSVKVSMEFIGSSFRQTSLVLLRLTTSELPKKESPNHDAKLMKKEKILEKRAVL